MRFGTALLALALGVAGCGDRAPTGPSAGPPGDGITDPDPGSITLPRREADGGNGSGGRRPLAPFVPGQMVIDLSIGTDLPTFNGRWGTTTLLELEDGQYALVDLPDGYDVRDFAPTVVHEGDCDVAQPNYHLEAPETNQGVVAFVETNHVFGDVLDQTAMIRIGVPTAHEFARGQGVTVAIIDTGIDGTHPDLAGFVIPGWDFVDEDADPTDEADGLDQDGDGLVDEAAGHGTHVAGIVHAVAPEAMLLAVRVMDSEGFGTSVNVSRGIRWAVDNGADVINLSLGLAVTADVVKDAIKYADDSGVFVVSSAGNRGIDHNHHFPARLSDVAAVASTNADDLKADFSNYGSHISVSAPGKGILSTYLDHVYAVWSGTSFSTPMVAGAAALWGELVPASSPDETRQAIEESALAIDYPGYPYDGKMGEGRLDVAKLTTR